MYTTKTLTVILTALFVLSVGSLAAQPAKTGAPERTSPAGERPQIIAYDGEDFTGEHTHIFCDIRRLGKWDNSISSMIILSGTWAFFDDQNLEGDKMAELGPGMYPKVTDKGIKNNSVSSVRLVSPKQQLSQRSSTR
jgi:Beta/Gamma crystallin